MNFTKESLKNDIQCLSRTFASYIFLKNSVNCPKLFLKNPKYNYKTYTETVWFNFSDKYLTG